MLARLPIAMVLDHVRAYQAGQGPEYLSLEGHRVSVSKTALRTFAMTGSCCSSCHLEGAHFEVVAMPAHGGMPAHNSLQLVAEVDGQRIRFTQDHTWARALGGSNHHFNLTTMCDPCNQRKSRHEMALVRHLRAEAGLMPDGRQPGTLATPHLGAALRAAGKYHLWAEQAQRHGAPRPASPLDAERLTEMKLRLESRAAALGLTPDQYRAGCETLARDQVVPPEARRLEPHAAQMAMSLAAYRLFHDDYGSRLEAAPSIARRLVATAHEAGIAIQPARVIPVPAKPRRWAGPR